jgi:Holliday junction resolvasome RuvABC endonuclease subunit
MNILGIDLGLTSANPCGVALVQTEPLQLRDWCELAPERGEDWPRAIDRLARDLADTLALWPVGIVAYEVPHLRDNTQTLVKLAHAGGVVRALAALRGLPCVGVSPAEAKLALAKNSQASKADMIAAAKQVFGVRLPKDVADAAGVALAGDGLWRRERVVRLAMEQVTR